MGFVEICLGDLPWNRDVEGWFELRYKELHTVIPLASACAAYTRSSLFRGELAADQR